MRRSVPAICLAILICSFALAQVPEDAPPPTPPATPPAPVAPPPPPPPPPRPAWKDKLFFGGGVGLSFGDVDYVEVAPLVGYQLHPRISAGLGLSYRWISDDRYTYSQDTSDYGANVFTRITVFRQVFAHLEYEYLNYEYGTSTGATFRDSASSFLAGAGFFQPMGSHGGFYASALYNFSYDENDPTSPYNDPWVYRIGATFGF